jgi:transposase
MERKERRHHTREFKLEAVRLAAVGDKTKAKVARELGVRVNQLRQWRLDFEEEERNGVPKQELASAEQDLGTLRRENARLREENEILKNRPRGLPRPICIETSGAYTDATPGQWPLAFWRHMFPSKNLVQGEAADPAVVALRVTPFRKVI